MDIGSLVETVTGLFGVFGSVAGTVSDFSGAWATLYDTLSTILEFVASFVA